MIEALLREFVATEPLEENERASDVCGFTCTYCWRSTGNAYDPVAHTDDCLWIRARNAVASSDAPSTL